MADEIVSIDSTCTFQMQFPATQSAQTARVDNSLVKTEFVTTEIQLQTHTSLLRPNVRLFLSCGNSVRLYDKATISQGSWFAEHCFQNPK